MNVLRSQAEPDLIYVVMTNTDAVALERSLKGVKGEVPKQLKRRLKAVLDAK